MQPQTGDEVIDAVLRAAHRLRTLVDAELRDEGLSLARMKVMRAVEGEARSMREVSGMLGIAPRSLTDSVDGLEAAGLVRRSPHLEDRRSTLLGLTETGRRVLDGLAQVSAERASALTATLGADERRPLIELLARVAPPEVVAARRAERALAGAAGQRLGKSE